MLVVGEVVEKHEDRLFLNLTKLLSFCYDGKSLEMEKFSDLDFEKKIIKNKNVCYSLENISKYKLRA